MKKSKIIICSITEEGRNITMDAIALILVIVGALNWGSIGLFGFDFVGALFGGQLSVLSRIIFALVGLGGLWTITFFFKDKVLNKREK